MSTPLNNRILTKLCKIIFTLHLSALTYNVSICPQISAEENYVRWTLFVGDFIHLNLTRGRR